MRSPGAVVKSTFFCLSPSLPTRSAHRGCTKVFRKTSFRPRRPLAYSTSFQRLDGTVARAKPGVFGNSGEEGRETRGGAREHSPTELIQTHCRKTGLLPHQHRVLCHFQGIFTNMASNVLQNKPVSIFIL